MTVVSARPAAAPIDVDRWPDVAWIPAKPLMIQWPDARARRGGRHGRSGFGEGFNEYCSRTSFFILRPLTSRIS
jgi:hypothetical protein